MIRGDRSDEEIGESEAFAGIPGAIDPLLEPLPRRIRRTDERQRGERRAPDQTREFDPDLAMRTQYQHRAVERITAPLSAMSANARLLARKRYPQAVESDADQLLRRLFQRIPSGSVR